jgi:hypothetical protein
MLDGNVKGMMVLVCPTNAGYCTHPNLDFHHFAKSDDQTVSP